MQLKMIIISGNVVSRIGRDRVKMYLLLTIFLLMLAIAVSYATNKHQRMFRKPISKKWRITSVLFFVAGIAVAAIQLSLSATVFFCTMLLMLCCILLPLATLLKKERSDYGEPR